MIKMNRDQFRKVQEKINFLGFGPIEEDGRDGPATQAAVKKFQKWAELDEDGIVGDMTYSRLFTTKSADLEPNAVDTPTLLALNEHFEPASAKRLQRCVTPLQRLALGVARRGFIFSVADSLRGREAQELAFRKGHSKARFGQSAHNYDPPVAYDFFPVRFTRDVDWDNIKAWYPVITAHQEVAKELNLSIRSLGDPNRDGKFNDGWDFPHIELHPWREAIKKYGSQLYTG